MRQGVARLCEGADLVIYDTMFTPEEYRRLPHYGHSRPSDAIEICREAGARRLALFHHAPERSDAEVDAHPRRRAGAGGAREDSARRRRRLRGPGPDAGARMIELTFWGVRGSIPAPGPGTVRYGGNTSCVSLRTAEGRLIVLDCGTGARNLGMSLLDGPFGRGQGQASILLSHAHWDHIQGFPFFVPLYIPGNKFNIFGGGKSSSMLEGILEGQMAPQYFPVQTLKNMGATIEIVAVAEGTPFAVEGCRVVARTNPHGRSGALAFRIESEGARGRLRERRRLRRGRARPSRRSISTAAPMLLIHDSTYTPEDRRRYRRARVLVDRGRGAVRGDRARVKKLVLFHYDQDYSDADVDALCARGRRLLDEQGGRQTSSLRGRRSKAADPLTLCSGPRCSPCRDQEHLQLLRHREVGERALVEQRAQRVGAERGLEDVELLGAELAQLGLERPRDRERRGQRRQLLEQHAVLVELAHALHQQALGRILQLLQHRRLVGRLQLEEALGPAEHAEDRLARTPC